MSENSTVTRSNFASRLLSKAMNDRSKAQDKIEEVTTADAAKYAAPTETRQEAAATKS